MKTERFVAQDLKQQRAPLLRHFVVHLLSCVWLQPHGLQHSGFPVLHYLLGFAQTRVHWVSDAIQPSHPLSSPSPPPFSLSQQQGLFQWVSSSHLVAKVLELQLQHQSFQWIIRVGFLLDWLVWSPCSPRDSQGLLQHHSSRVSVLQHSAFFMMQVRHYLLSTLLKLLLSKNIIPSG